MKRSRSEMNRRRRRGVAAVLAMMFLVIFSSLAVVMGVVAQGNLRTAHSHLQVNRAYSAAEAGLVFATRRLAAAGRRFVISRGAIDADLGEKLWKGTWDVSIDGDVEILPPDGFIEDTPASSLVTAIENAHLADSHNVVLEPWHETLPAIDEYCKLIAQPIALSDATNPPTFQLSYQLVGGGYPYIRVTSVGRDDDMERTLSADFVMTKTLDAAIISPNRVMIGKNVFIDGPIGTRYGQDVQDLDAENGHPLVVKSDFRYLDDVLDAQIATLIESITAYDVDGDNRLRPGHPTESAGLTEPFLMDFNGDGYVDDYDLFVGFFDNNPEDQYVVYDEALALAAGRGSMSAEFDRDLQLASLIDSIHADRNGDGEVDAEDTALGYRDGVIDNLDNYSKVNGNLLFKTSREAWETAQGVNYQDIVQGPLHTATDQASSMFEVDDTQLYDLSIDDFVNAGDNVKALTLDGSFEDQLTAQLGHSPSSHVWSDHATDPDFLRQPLGPWEQMPFGSPGFYDWYQRPVYKNMTFVDVRIPIGDYDGGTLDFNNGLFINCVFIGAVYVQTYSGLEQEHHNWNFLGIKEQVGGNYIDKYDYAYWEPVLEVPGYPSPILDTKPLSNNVRFHDCVFLGSVVTDSTSEFTHIRNKLQFTGTTDFILDPAELPSTNLSPEQLATALAAFEANKEELEKSTLLAPNFSVDVGTFENTGEKVSMQGTIVAGVLDVRGTAEVEGTLLMTYKPVANAGPLYYGGSVASFNTTIGYFGPNDGDGEGELPGPGEGFGEITVRYNPNMAMPDGIMAPIKIVFVGGTYHEGGSL